MTGLATALKVLGDALLKQDAHAIEAAAREAASALKLLENSSPDRAGLEQLAELNRRTGALLAARQATLNWALSRLTPSARTYGADGQHAVAPAPRRLASA